MFVCNYFSFLLSGEIKKKTKTKTKKQKKKTNKKAKAKNKQKTKYKNHYYIFQVFSFYNVLITHLVRPAFECTIGGGLVGMTLPPLSQRFGVMCRYGGHAKNIKTSRKISERKTIDNNDDKNY